jgi:hypothetical protein
MHVHLAAPYRAGGGGDATLARAWHAISVCRELRQDSIELQAELRDRINRTRQFLRRLPRSLRGGSGDPDPDVLDALRVTVRRRLAEGLLPKPDGKTWAGPGTGRMCVICEKAITPKQIEYEVPHGDDAGRLYAHIPCFLMWKAEATGR